MPRMNNSKNGTKSPVGKAHTQNKKRTRQNRQEKEVLYRLFQQYESIIDANVRPRINCIQCLRKAWNDIVIAYNTHPAVELTRNLQQVYKCYTNCRLRKKYLFTNMPGGENESGLPSLRELRRQLPANCECSCNPEQEQKENGPLQWKRQQPELCPEYSDWEIDSYAEEVDKTMEPPPNTTEELGDQYELWQPKPKTNIAVSNNKSPTYKSQPDEKYPFWQPKPGAGTRLKQRKDDSALKQLISICEGVNTDPEGDRVEEHHTFWQPNSSVRKRKVPTGPELRADKQLCEESNVPQLIAGKQLCEKNNVPELRADKRLCEENNVPELIAGKQLCEENNVPELRADKRLCEENNVPELRADKRLCELNNNEPGQRSVQTQTQQIRNKDFWVPETSVEQRKNQTQIQQSGDSAVPQLKINSKQRKIRVKIQKLSSNFHQSLSQDGIRKVEPQPQLIEGFELWEAISNARKMAVRTPPNRGGNNNELTTSNGDVVQNSEISEEIIFWQPDTNSGARKVPIQPELSEYNEVCDEPKPQISEEQIFWQPGINCGIHKFKAQPQVTEELSYWQPITNSAPGNIQSHPDSNHNHEQPNTENHLEISEERNFIGRKNKTPQLNVEPQPQPTEEDIERQSSNILNNETTQDNQQENHQQERSNNQSNGSETPFAGSECPYAGQGEYQQNPHVFSGAHQLQQHLPVFSISMQRRQQQEWVLNITRTPQQQRQPHNEASPPPQEQQYQLQQSFYQKNNYQSPHEANQQKHFYQPEVVYHPPQQENQQQHSYHNPIYHPPQQAYEPSQQRCIHIQYDATAPEEGRDAAQQQQCQHTLMPSARIAANTSNIDTSSTAVASLSVKEKIDHLNLRVAQCHSQLQRTELQIRQIQMQSAKEQWSHKREMRRLQLEVAKTRLRLVQLEKQTQH